MAFGRQLDGLRDGAVDLHACIGRHQHAHRVPELFEHRRQRAAHVAEAAGLDPRRAFRCDEENLHDAAPRSTANGRPCALENTLSSPSTASPVRGTSCSSPVNVWRHRAMCEIASAPRSTCVTRHTDKNQHNTSPAHSVYASRATMTTTASPSWWRAKATAWSAASLRFVWGLLVLFSLCFVCVWCCC